MIDASFLRDDPAWPEAVACLRGILSDVVVWDIDEGGERGEGACYSDRERLASRVVVRRMVGGIVRKVHDQTGGCIEVTREKVREHLG